MLALRKNGFPSGILELCRCLRLCSAISGFYRARGSASPGSIPRPIWTLEGILKSPNVITGQQPLPVQLFLIFGVLPVFKAAKRVFSVFTGIQRGLDG